MVYSGRDMILQKPVFWMKTPALAATIAYCRANI